VKQAILDTDILSYVFDGRYPEVDAQARQYLRVFRYFSISAVTVSEVMEGLESEGNYSGIAVFRKRLESLEIFPVETEEAVIAGQILGILDRNNQSIGDLDPFIAATAIVNQRPLITNNQKHYQRIVDLGFTLTLDNWRNA